MAEDDQASDPVKAAEPGAEPLNGVVIDLAVAGKGGDGSGNETSEIKRCHGVFLQVASLVIGWRDFCGSTCLHSALWLSAPGERLAGGFVLRAGQLMGKQ
jgi:hypothetical protein